MYKYDDRFSVESTCIGESPYMPGTYYHFTIYDNFCNGNDKYNYFNGSYGAVVLVISIPKEKYNREFPDMYTYYWAYGIKPDLSLDFINDLFRVAIGGDKKIKDDNELE